MLVLPFLNVCDCSHGACQHCVFGSAASPFGEAFVAQFSLVKVVGSAESTGWVIGSWNRVRYCGLYSDYVVVFVGMIRVLSMNE